MTKPRPSQVLGRWRITEIEGWDADYVDLLGPGHIQLDPDGGHVEFGAVQIGLEYQATSGTQPRATLRTHPPPLL